MLLINGAEYWSEIIAVAIMIVAGLVLSGFIKNRLEEKNGLSNRYMR